MSFTASRRGFLRRTLGACWASASLLEQAVFRATAARAQSRDALPTLFDIQKIADGVYAAIARPAALINSNAVIFENSSDLLIVDTHSKPSAVASLVTQIRRQITSKPVRYVVNSHFHWDHSQGTPAYKRIAPHTDIVSSEATRKLIAELGSKRLQESVEQSRKMVQSYKEKLAAAQRPEEKTYWQTMVRDTNEYISEMRNYTPELPNVTFDRDLVIHDKVHDLHLAFRGRAHTAGDIVVFCPQKKVVATGDMLHGFAPFVGDGYPLEWPRTLLHVAEMPFDQVAGGHAGVQQGRERLYQMAGYIEEVTEAVVVGRRAGKPVVKIQEEVTPESLKSLGRGGYGDYLVESNTKYRPNPPGSRPDLRELVRTGVAQTYAALERG